MINCFLQKEQKPWGYELIFSQENSPITAKILHLNAGARFSLQFHETKEELLTLISGSAKLIYGTDKDNLEETEMELKKGYFIPKGIVHRVQAITDADVFESSTQEKGTTYRLEDDYSRPNETEELGKEERKQNVKCLPTGKAGTM